MEKHKAYIRIINLKYLLQHGVMNLNYLMDHNQYQIFKIILSILLTIHQKKQMLIKLKIELHLKLKMDFIWNF